MNSIKFNQQGIEAILNGSKTMTRRPIKVRTDIDKQAWIDTLIPNYSKYKVGEIVKAVCPPPSTLEYKLEWRQRYPIVDIKILSFKVERLQDISEEDCIKEGIIEVPFRPDDGFPMCIGYSSYPDDGVSSLPNTAKEAFECDIWNNLPYEKPYDWNSNPYVFVYEFEKVKQ